MQSISKYIKGIRFLFCVINNFSKYAWIILLKEKRSTTITNAFQKGLDESNRKPNETWVGFFSKYAWVVTVKDKKGINIVSAFQSILDSSKRKPKKIWVDQGSEFYNSSFKKWLKENPIEMYSTYNEGKFVVAERFIRTFKNEIYQHMTDVSKNVYFDVLNDIVDKYINAYHNTIKMKPIDIKYNSYAEYNVESNEKDPKFKFGDHVRISKVTNIFAKGYASNSSQKDFVIKKIKLQFHGLMLLMI